MRSACWGTVDNDDDNYENHDDYDENHDDENHDDDCEERSVILQSSWLNYLHQRIMSSQSAISLTPAEVLTWCLHLYLYLYLYLYCYLYLYLFKHTYRTLPQKF